MIKIFLGAWLALNSPTGLTVSQNKTVMLHAVEGEAKTFVVCYNDLCLPVKVGKDGVVKTPRTKKK